MTTDEASSDDDPQWERPERRRLPRLVWVGALVAAVAVAAGVVDGTGDDGEDLTVDEDEAEDAPAPSPPPDLGDDARWRAHHDLDSAQAVEVDGDGRVWVGTTGGGLVRFDADGDGYLHRELDLDELTVGGRRLGGDGLGGPGVGGFGVSVTSVAADGDGTIWVVLSPRGPTPPDRGTGVVEVAGDAVTAHTPGDGLPEAAVRSVAVDDHGTVWAATTDGLATYDGEEWTARTGDDGPGHSHVADVQVAADGAVWAQISEFPGSGGGGVARFDGDAWTTWSADEDLPHERVTALAAGADGSVWLTARREVDPTEGRPDPPTPGEPETELLRFDGDAWAVEVVDDELPVGRVRSLAVDEAGAVWVAASPRWRTSAADDVVFRFDGQVWAGYGREDGLPHQRVKSVTVTDDGAVWTATAGGAARYADGRWVAATTGQGPAGSRLASVAVDDQGTVWTAGEAGVARYDGQSWTSWTATDGLASDMVTSVVVADDGAVWAGTMAGVSRFDGQSWTSWTADDGLAYQGVGSLAAGEDGTVWAVVRTWPPEPDTALARFDGQSWTSWTADDVPTDGGLTAVEVDEHGAVWVGVRAAHDDGPKDDAVMLRRHGGEWATFTPDGGLGQRGVAAIAVGDGHVWAGTGDGVARFDGSQWVYGREADDLGLEFANPAGREPISALAVATDGVVWAGGFWGVARFDGHEWVEAEDPGLSTQSIAVADDRVWMATPRGLLEFTEDG